MGMPVIALLHVFVIIIISIACPYIIIGTPDELCG